MKDRILALLKGMPVTVYLVAGALALFLSWLAINNAHQRALGKQELLTAAARADGKVWKHRADSLEKVYRVDTVRFTRLRVQTDTMTQTVEQWKHDTVEVVRYVVRADSTIRACSQALQTCEQRVGAERAQKEAVQTELKILKAQMPGKLTPWRHRAEGALAGAALGTLLRTLK